MFAYTNVSLKDLGKMVGVVGFEPTYLFTLNLLYIIIINIINGRGVRI